MRVVDMFHRGMNRRIVSPFLLCSGLLSFGFGIVGSGDFRLAGTPSMNER